MKSVYSLVLSDEVVSDVDKAAYQKGVSRSAMIDEILAERLSLETPQKRRADVFRHLEELFLGSGMRYLARSSGTAADFFSALNYRYNPTVRYAVTLYEGSERPGEIRVSLRSQNTALLGHFNAFFALFDRLERQNGSVDSEAENGRYTRYLLPETQENGGAGQQISVLIERINRLLECYFDALSTGADAEKATAQLYRKLA